MDEICMTLVYFTQLESEGTQSCARREVGRPFDLHFRVWYLRSWVGIKISAIERDEEDSPQMVKCSKVGAQVMNRSFNLEMLCSAGTRHEFKR